MWDHPPRARGKLVHDLVKVRKVGTIGRASRPALDPRDGGRSVCTCRGDSKARCRAVWMWTATC